MKKRIGYLLVIAITVMVGFSHYSCNNTDKDVNTDELLTYCSKQVSKTLFQIQNDSSKLPRSIEKHGQKWSMIDASDWTSGFWPGILWYTYEFTRDDFIKSKAEQYTQYLTTLLDPDHSGDHDLGFQFLCSFGNAYRLTNNEHYKKIMLDGASKLALFYNPKAGTMLSWGHMVEEMDWPHNTIMDNMMNLELLFWAAKNGGDPNYYAMAENHARVTMKNQFRPDYTSYHVAVYDTTDGKFIKGVTNQGYSDESFWARGQAWGIYGYTVVYRETRDKEFLRFVEKIADIYLKQLPGDYIPYWDFDDPSIPNAPKDASAAAIASSALLELARLEDSKKKAMEYKFAALKMLESLSSEAYLSGEKNPSFLLHTTGNYPSGYEIDASLNYADYYYIEALIRLHSDLL